MDDMNTTRGTGQTGTTPTQLKERLKSTLSQADQQAGQSVHHLSLVHQARTTQLSRTAAALKARYGPKDPQVKTAEAAVTASTTTAGRIAIVHQQLATPAPQVPSTGWAVYGRVFSSDSKPAPNLTVFLVDAQKAFYAAAGFTYTDATGYFLLTSPGSASENTGEQASSSQAPADQAPASQDTAAQDTAEQAAEKSPPPQPKPHTAPLPRLLLEITSEDEQPIYIDASPVPLTVGRASYRSIVLPPGQRPLGNPPEAVRRTAFPEGEKP